MKFSLPVRPKRNRSSENVRSMLRETTLDINNFIYPLFINANIDTKREIASMPGQFQLSYKDLKSEITEISKLQIKAVLLFGIPNHKDKHGSDSTDENGVIQNTIKRIKDINPDLTVIADVCLCEYTDHGHCGVLKDNKQIDNDATLEILAKQAVSFAKAGADWLAPSSMTDGMVFAIRKGLDENNLQDKSILSYAVKYASNLYGPFRAAAEGAPKFGDRKTYQMDPANSQEAVREASLDIEEGADILMIKPANYYLDIIYKIKQAFPFIPLCAYQVSGEYSMIKFAAKSGIIDENKIILESLLAIKRAKADLIISYFAKDLAKIFDK
jgi:porphobilinogen synthase